MEIKDFLIKMNAVPHVTGYENELAAVISDEFSKYADTSVDRFGNLIALKRGTGGLKVMISAHMDEIGMMVSHIGEGGFVKFSRIGGIDRRNMVAQEVTIHGREKVYGVIGIKPPHLTKPEETKKNVELHDMAIDTGFSEEKLKTLIKVGDIITLNANIVELQNNKISCKALDDIAGVAAMYVAMKNLEYFKHSADVYFVASTQEEVGLRGATTAAYNVKPDIGIAVDVGFARSNDLGEHESIEMGKGPSISVGPNMNRKLFECLKKTAINNNIKYQVEVQHKMSGTDTAAIQIANNGVITGLLSIPMKYMHSTVETVAIGDIISCGRLISEFIMGLNNQSGEDILCF